MNAEQILKCSNLKALENNQGGKEWGDKYSGKKGNIVRQADTFLLFTLRHFTTDKLCKVKRQGDKHNETHKKLKTLANFVDIMVLGRHKLELESQPRMRGNGQHSILWVETHK